MAAAGIALLSLTSMRQVLKEFGHQVMPWRFTPSWLVGEKPTGYYKKLIGSIKAKQSTNESLHRRIFLIGDSHAYNHYPSLLKALHVLGLDKNIEIDIVSINITGATPAETNSWKRALLSVQEKSENGDILIFASDQSKIRSTVARAHTETLGKLDPLKTLTAISRIHILKNLAQDQSMHMLLTQDLPIPCLNKLLESSISTKHQYTRHLHLKGYSKSCEYPASLHFAINGKMEQIYNAVSKEFTSNPDGKLLIADFTPDLCS